MPFGKNYTDNNQFMKKIFLAFTLGITALFSAQTHFGVKAGYLNSSLKWDSSPNTFLQHYSDFDSKSYFYIGGFAEYPVSPKFSIQGELFYTELGGKTKVELYRLVGSTIVYEGHTEAAFKYPQIQIPLSAKFYALNNFAVLGGFNFGFNLNPDVKFSDVFNGFPSGKIEDTKTLTVFPFLGAEYKFIQNFSVDARYNFGLGNMQDNNLKVKSNFFQIGLGYYFK